MSAALGLALTGAVLLLAALVLAFAADSSRHYSTERRLATVGWITFAAAVLVLIAAIWTEVMTR